MKTFTQYLIEKIEMKAPSKERHEKNENGNIVRHWTTSKGNRIGLEFLDAGDGWYEVSFVVNDSTTEDITRSSDREILQTLLYQIKKTIDENDIDNFTFDAWYDGMDVKSVSKMLKPYSSELAQYIKKYKSDYSISPELKRILSYFPYANETHYVNQNIRRINHLLNYPDLDNDFKQFLEKLKTVMLKLFDMIDSGEVHNAPNRRLAIYKRLMSQYLGPEWKVEPKGRNGMRARKIHSDHE